jgi:gluconolactonase
MLFSPPTVEALVWSRLPEAFHYQGEPTAWVRVTRPGQRLHSFLEGLTLAPDGSFYLADVPYGRIFRVAPGGDAWDEVLRYDGEPHGLAYLPGGKLLVADYRKGLLQLDLERSELDALCSQTNTENFRGLSDLVLDAEGAIWFTDSGRTSLSDPTGRLFKLAPDSTLTRVLDNIPYPNGVAISADSVHVFIAVTRANAVWKLLRNPPERGTPMVGTYIQLSGGLGPDGLAVGPRGELAVAHAQAGCVWLFDALGMPRARVVTPGGLWTTSVRFGGPDASVLYAVDAQTGSIFAYDLRELAK